MLAARPPIHVHPRKPRASPTVRAAKPAPLHLEDRDVAILTALSTHRVLSAEQVRRLFFVSPSCHGELSHPATAGRRLRRLFDHRLVDRLAALPLRTP